MSCGGCEERREILRAELPNIRSVADIVALSRKLAGTLSKPPDAIAKPWITPPSINKDGSPHKPQDGE